MVVVVRIFVLINKIKMNKFCKNCGKRVLSSNFCKGCNPSFNDSEKITQNQSAGNAVPNLLTKMARQKAVQLMLRGIVLAVIGGIVTWITYSSAKPGGTYYVCSGLIFFGGLGFLIGLTCFIFPRLLIKK